MRKAAVMIGFGAFFITMALLMRFYAYPKLAVIPQDQNTQQLVKDDRATYFDAPTVKPGAGKILTKVTVVADKAASKKASDELGRNVVVVDQWQSTATVKSDGSLSKPPMDAYTAHYAVDASTGAAIEGWKDSTKDGKPFNPSGQTVKFPFNTSKDGSYEYFDSTLNKAFPVKFAGEEKLKGLTVYKFTQSVPRTKFTTMDVPPTIFGLPDGNGVVADRFYQNERTLWIEPTTGVMMKVQEKQHQELVVPNAKPVNAMTTTSTMTDETVTKNVDEYKTKATQLKILRVTAPIVLGLIGLLALALGLFMSLRARPGGRHGASEERSFDERAYDTSDETQVDLRRNH